MGYFAVKGSVVSTFFMVGDLVCLVGIETWSASAAEERANTEPPERNCLGINKRTISFFILIPFQLHMSK